MDTAPVIEPRESTPGPMGPASEPKESALGYKEPTPDPKEPTPESTKRIPKPNRLYQQKPADIYHLLGIPHSERLAILESLEYYIVYIWTNTANSIFSPGVQVIYRDLKMTEVREPWRNLPSDLRKDALSSFAVSYPRLASQCEENWFAAYVFYRRHKASMDELARTRKRGASMNS